MKQLLFMLVATALLLTSCQKDVVNTSVSETGVEKVLQTPSKEDMNLMKNGDPSFTFANLNAKVTLENGILVFETAEDWHKVTNFLQKAAAIEISKWENSLSGFHSNYRNYFNAKKELEATDNIELVKSKYLGKISFDDEGNIKPLIEMGKTFGSIINELGMYRIGTTLIGYFADKHFTIWDGKVETFNYAKSTLKTDTSKGIYVRNLLINTEPKSSQVDIRALICNTSCTTKHQQTVKNSANNARLRNAYFFEDQSVPLSGSFLAKVGFHIDVDQERKKGLIFWVGENSGFNWGFGWGVSITSNLGVTGATGKGSRFPLSQGGWSWADNGPFMNVDIWLLDEEWSRARMGSADLTATSLNGLKVCIGRSGLVSTSNRTDLPKNEQFCWSDGSM
jgi:hypothetical protein